MLPITKNLCKKYKVIAKLNKNYRDNMNFQHLWDNNYYYEDEKS